VLPICYNVMTWFLGYLTGITAICSLLSLLSDSQRPMSVSLLWLHNRLLVHVHRNYRGWNEFYRHQATRLRAGLRSRGPVIYICVKQSIGVNSTMGKILKMKCWELLEISNHYLFAFTLRILLKLIRPKLLKRKGGGRTLPQAHHLQSASRRGVQTKKIIMNPSNHNSCTWRGTPFKFSAGPLIRPWAKWLDVDKIHVVVPLAGSSQEWTSTAREDVERIMSILKRCFCTVH